MKAVVKSKAEPGLWLEEVPVPKVEGDDVLIRVLKTSICGTDIHIYNWDAWAQKTIPVPMTIGHEFAGVVDAVGDHVKGFAKGDLVVGEGHITKSVRSSDRKGEGVRRGTNAFTNRLGAFGTQGHSISEAYGLFATTCGAGLITSSCALTFWICAACSFTIAASRSTVPSNSAILFC